MLPQMGGAKAHPASSPLRRAVVGAFGAFWRGHQSRGEPKLLVGPANKQGRQQGIAISVNANHNQQNEMSTSMRAAPPKR